ncbi:MAG: NAD(P)/FAD-dependent oxidoreductase [Proteobacteria bacterium]|nr:MAG: NAD(P)/FAD-dependent oxidoreductase [Pseudomonadota bacterium]TDJ73684.1 MAG: NAD(P)/FAD-dependent oxidoreductase [Pseudomonadota bacterium]
MNYLIVGAGPAGVIAAETVRKTDVSSSVVLIGNEPEPPYSRMAIPYLLAEHVGEDGTYLRHAANHYETLNIDVRRATVCGVTPATKTVTLESGTSLPYDQLLIATGSHTVRPPIPGMALPGIENCWTLEDARRIAQRAKPSSRLVLMGAGFIGCIVLQALAARKVKLTVVEMADRMLPRMMDETGGEMIKRWCENKGVRVLTSTRITAIEQTNGALQLTLGDDGTLDADLVVCATGVRPNVAFLKGSGVEVDAGIVVDSTLQTSVPGIYAAGDVAQGPDLSTGKREVHAIQPTASEHGRIAARNMAGRKTSFRGSLSMNVLNTVGLISSSFGLWMGVDGGDQVKAIDTERSKYLRLEFDDDVIVGALALGLTQHVGMIRGLVQTRVKLGAWKNVLMKDPHRVMDAYLDRVHGKL